MFTRACAALPVVLCVLGLFCCCAIGADAEEGLVGYWKFDEGRGKTCRDNSGKGNHARLLGNPRRVAGFSGQTLQLTGAGDYATCGKRPALDLRKAVTVELRLKVLSIPQQGEPVVVGKGVNAGYTLTYAKDGVGPTGSRLYFYIGGENVATVVELKKWQHVVATYDGKEMNLYLEGKLMGNRRPKARSIPPAGSLVMGKGGLNAAIDEVRIYNRALSPEEVRARHRPGPVIEKPTKDKDPATGKKGPAPPMPWRDSKEGITDKVLAPWTPIKVKRVGESGLQIDTWGRTHYFEGSPFPMRITTKGRRILTEPIRVRARADGRELVWGSPLLKVETQTPAKILFSYDASSADGAAELSGKATVEYDGMMRIDWKIRARKPMTLEALTFEMLIPAERAKYFDWAYNSVTRARTQPQFGRLPVQGFFKGYMPFLWIGDDERGLNWMCESDRNWFNADPDRAIQVVRAGENVVVKVHLVSRPVRLSPDGKDGARELAYTFGLMATPAKPMKRDGWDLRIMSAPAYGRDYAFVNEKFRGKNQLDSLAALGVKTIMLFNWTDVLCHTTPIGHEHDLRRLVEACHAKGLKVIVYFGSQMSESAPEWPHIGEAIRVMPENRGGDSYPGMDRQFVNMVCNRSMYQDFIVHGLAKLMDEYGLDGVYLDGVGGAWYCNNTRHGCGYRKPDGTIRRTFPYFSTRRTIRRIYTVVKSRKPDGIVFVHQSSQMLAPVAAWVDLAWSGEQFGEGKAFPLDVLPLDAFRCELTGRQLGTPVDFIFYTAFRPPPERRRVEDWIAAHRKTHSLTLLHDVLAMGTGMNSPNASIPMIELQSSLWKLSDRFGRKEADWLPYWRNAEFVTAESQDVHVSLYKHPKNGVLAVVSNLGREAAAARVKFNLRTLGLAPTATAKDALTDDPIPLQAGRAEFKLPSLDWKVVWLR